MPPPPLVPAPPPAGGMTAAAALVSTRVTDAATAERTWHAKLSALGARSTLRTAGRARVGGEPRRRSLSGASLDAGLVGVPVVWKSASTRTLLAGDTCAGGTDVGLAPGDDNTGRQRWLLVAVPGAVGEYNVMVYEGRECSGGCWFLGASGREGAGVRLWPEDDGSGRQRWVFTQRGDSRFTISLAGGKADDAVFLGADGDRGARLVSGERGERVAWDVAVVPYCDAAEAPPAGAAAGQEEDDDDVESAPEEDEEASRNTHVPRLALRRLPWLTERQVDMIMQLVGLPENSTPKWFNNYGYIEFLGDGRGFTATIFGACSGTGDLHLVLQELSKVKDRSKTCDRLLEYKDAVGRKKGDDIRGIEGIKPLIQKLGDDPAWQEAVWRAFLKLYWTFALEWADKRGSAAGRPGPRITSVAGRGFMLDTAVNHGANRESFQPIINRMRRPDARDERAWLEDFARARMDLLRSGYQELDTSGTGDRCRLWLPLLADNPDLRPPIKAYKGYWGKFTLT